MGMPIQFTRVLAAANGTSVAAVQAHTAAGSLTLSGTPVTLDAQRRIDITLTASNSADAIVIYGTNQSGTPISETITISATGTSFTSAMDYLTVTTVTATALTGNISVGTSATGSSPWQMANPWCDPAQIHVGVTLSSGAATYSCEYTMDLDPCGVKNNTPLTAVNAFTAGLLSALTTSGSALIGPGTSGQPVPVTAWRVTTTTGTGTLVVQAVEAGIG